MPFHEHIPSDEQVRFDAYATELRTLQQARTRAGSPGRALHLKQHMGVTGELVVGDLPESLRCAVFVQPTRWPVYLRFSSGSMRHQEDGVPDVRGVAIKLVGVSGKKLIPALADETTQDFVFIQTPATPFRNPDEFMRFVRAAADATRPVLLFRMFASFGWRALTILKELASMPKVQSMATARFYTAAPLRFGASAAKLALFPVVEPGDAAARLGHDLRTDLIARLKSGPLSYSLRVQLFIDDETTPIEDNSVVWPEAKSPFVELARLTIPRQDVEAGQGPAVEQRVEQMSFDPWHAVEALRPLGAMMRARASAYRASAIERHAAPEPRDVLGVETGKMTGQH